MDISIHTNKEKIKERYEYICNTGLKIKRKIVGLDI